MAFHDLVVRYQRPVFTLILRMVRDRETAEDLAQETFLKAYRRLDTYDPQRKLSSWLFKIAHNTALDHLRRGTLATEPLDDTGPGDEGAPRQWQDPHAQDPEQRLQRRDLAAAIEAAVAQLRPEYRSIVLLRYQQDLAYEEIADITGLPMGTVKTHLHRARKELADLLAGAETSSTRPP